MTRIITAFAMVFIAEMGDKTQLFLIGLSSKYRLRTIIAAVAAAIAVLNGAAVAVGYFIGGKIDPTYIKFIAGAAFLVFAYTTLLPKRDEDEKSRGGAAFFAVFFSFLLAELGDKTQLMTLTLSAEASADGGSVATIAGIFAACSLGLFAADMIGMLAGYFLSKKLPERALGCISFVIFTFFGIYTVYEAVDKVTNGAVLPVVLTVASVTAAFAALCGATLFVLHKKKETTNEKADSKGNESV